MRFTHRFMHLALILFLLGVYASGQTKPASPDTRTDNEATQDDDEVIKVETNLVTVPVIVSNRDGGYLPDLTKEEFTVEENGKRQDIAFFATTQEPFHVVLMIDTSGSTEEKLVSIRRAATVFVAQLQAADRIKLISFDDTVKDAGDFTADRAQISSRIAGLRSGKGTRLYDAVAHAMRMLQPIQKRKAIVIFTDGVDFHSDRETYERNRRALEEAGIIVYPIRYETRRETERIAREQAGGSQTVDVGTILGGGSRRDGSGGGGTTAPTFPGGTSPTIPDTRQGGGIGIPNFPVPIIINRRRNDPYPGGTRTPGGTYPDTRDDGRNGGINNPFPDGRDDSRNGGINRYPDGRGGRVDDSINVMLDRLYRTADEYLDDLARESGGRVLRADTLNSLPDAFAQIAAELRTQYSLGYYPTLRTRDGKYRKIKVRTTRKNVYVRTRPGYRLPANQK
ncbi:MAG: VWA domain-containing protein [Pyrinomonadaceae bacterium MAG19_C2-C3]|nr:VWA domain-containing protein [Pyrinomonadaceae bacterium MAG19_C2-C3]